MVADKGDYEDLIGVIGGKIGNDYRVGFGCGVPIRILGCGKGC
jgi:hypothetical protein